MRKQQERNVHSTNMSEMADKNQVPLKRKRMRSLNKRHESDSYLRIPIELLARISSWILLVNKLEMFHSQQSNF